MYFSIMPVLPPHSSTLSIDNSSGSTFHLSIDRFIWPHAASPAGRLIWPPPPPLRSLTMDGEPPHADGGRWARGWGVCSPSRGRTCLNSRSRRAGRRSTCPGRRTRMLPLLNFIRCLPGVQTLFCSATFFRPIHSLGPGA